MVSSAFVVASVLAFLKIPGKKDTTSYFIEVLLYKIVSGEPWTLFLYLLCYIVFTVLLVKLGNRLLRLGGKIAQRF